MTSGLTAPVLASLARLEGVPSAMASARDGIDVLLRDRGLRRTTPAQTAESLLRGAQASATLAGSDSTAAAIAEGVGDETAQAALRISAELLGLAPVLERSPLQAFARIHTLAAAGDPDAGRPRDADAAALLQEVGRWLTARDAAVPALVLAAVAHAELATAAPFGSHDGLVARAVERLILVSTGLDEKSLTVPEAGHLALRPAYDARLAAWSQGTQAARHAWLLYAAEAYAAGAEASPLKG